MAATTSSVSRSSFCLLLVLVCAVVVSTTTMKFVASCGHGLHNHNDHGHDEEGRCLHPGQQGDDHHRDSNSKQHVTKVTTELVRSFPTSIDQQQEENRGEEFELVNLISVRFSHKDDGLTTNAEWTCNPEIVGVELTKSRKVPHGYYAVPADASSKNLRTEQKKGAVNENSIRLFAQDTANDLVEKGLAEDAISTSQHDDIPLHAIAFDHPAIAGKSFVHLFRDPRFERLHSGHFPTSQEEELREKQHQENEKSDRRKDSWSSYLPFGNNKNKKIRRHNPGEQMPLPKDHPSHECQSKGECHVDRVHQRATSVEMFWIPQSVQEVVFSCSHVDAQKINKENKRKTKESKLAIHKGSASVKIETKDHQQQQHEQVDPRAQPDIVPPSLRPQLYSSLRLQILPHVALREAEALATSATPEVIKLREVGPPETTYSVVFLSGGYTLADRQMFVDNVTAIADMLMDPQMDLALPQDTVDSIANIHRTCPFNRYFGFWNAYAVFQPSGDRGASRPLKNLVVDNNLGCYHPAEIERAVSCDRAVAAALVKVSPAPFAADPERVVIICLVNTDIYGGSAIYIPGKMHFANFFNGFYLDKVSDRERMLSLVDHEIGHALGNLMDEYSVGVDEPSGRYIKNCQVGSGGPPASPQWKKWIDLKNGAGSSFKALYGNDLVGAPNWDVLGTPSVVCGFTNYYKPNANCMMHRLNDFFMCPVCREQATTQVFTSKFVYEFPRLPFKDQVLFVSTDTSVVPRAQMSLNTSSTVVVHLNRLVTKANGFTIQAFDTDGTPLTVVQTSSCPACIQLGPANFAKYIPDTEVRITVNITDNTRNFLLPNQLDDYPNQLKQATYFRIVVTSTHPANISGSTLYNYSSKAEFNAELGQVGYNDTDLIPRYVFCLHRSVVWENRALETPLQKNNTFCSFNLSRAASTYEQPSALKAIEADLDTWVPIVLAIMAIIFIMLWLWASQKYTDMADGKVRPIFKTELSGMLTLVRGIMTLAAVIFLIASIVAIGGAAYVYYNTSLLGKIFVLFGIVLAVILYLMAFFGFWAVSSRSKRMLVVNGVVLIIPLGIGIWVLITLNAFGTELNGAATWQPNLNATNSDGVSAKEQIGVWMQKLEELWQWMVATQPAWACSFQGVLECSGYYTSCAGTLGSTATCPVGCDDINERFTAPCQKRLQDYIVQHYSYAVTAVALGTALLGGGFLLNTLNFVLLWKEKSNIQNRNAGTIQREANRLGNPALAQKKHDMYSMMLLKALDKSDRTALIREFKRIDRDGNGELTRGELAYFISGALKHKPSKAEIDKIFTVADLDSSGTISLREFLMIFGWESGEIDSVSRPAPRAGPLQKMASFARLTGKEVPPNYVAAASGPAAGASARKPSRMQELSPDQMAAMRSQMRQRARDAYGEQFVNASPQAGAGEMNSLPSYNAATVSPRQSGGGDAVLSVPSHHQRQAQLYQQQQQQQQGRPAASSVSQQPIAYQRAPPDEHFEL